MNNPSKRYLKLYKESGCILANYQTQKDDDESIIIPFENNESSGRFKFSRKKGLE
ncbi:hypothetical protein [Crassaminicella profunda]|uniref:hypothetical protein n=1 Tax=Crassaminicella profunda TaxID=1286698 RepID=UPI001CA6B7F7|nr:hypothetical protein [Crassaminicella profunda]QZY56017.1 hypothetical protein K7H06_03160 [Crassaminicella profunda]